jgi:hypothetical protein
MSTIDDIINGIDGEDWRAAVARTNTTKADTFARPKDEWRVSVDDFTNAPNIKVEIGRDDSGYAFIEIESDNTTLRFIADGWESYGSITSSMFRGRRDIADLEPKETK